MDDSIADLARDSYAVGIPPLTYAEHLVKMIIEVHRSAELLADDLNLPPDKLGAGPLASLIVGALLEAGWVPPCGGVL
jgi:hypothetical protein